MRVIVCAFISRQRTLVDEKSYCLFLFFGRSLIFPSIALFWPLFWVAHWNRHWSLQITLFWFTHVTCTFQHQWMNCGESQFLFYWISVSEHTFINQEVILFVLYLLTIFGGFVSRIVSVIISQQSGIVWTCVCTSCIDVISFSQVNNYLPVTSRC